MGSRLELQTLLETMATNVYFQPPASPLYPCIMYNVNGVDDKFADDKKYISNTQYSIQVIDSNPESQIVESIKSLATSKFIISYVKDNLHYTVFTLFY